MNTIHVSKIIEINEYWIVYRGDNQSVSHVDLSASANTFEKSRQYVSEDALRCVGLRYTDGSGGYYELFNIGHTRFYCPQRPNPISALLARLRGKDPAAQQKEAYEAIEAQLNANGWKTIEASNDPAAV